MQNWNLKLSFNIAILEGIKLTLKYCLRHIDVHKNPILKAPSVSNIA